MTLINCGGKDDPLPCVPPDGPAVKKMIVLDAGQPFTLTASLIANATYKWTGPSNYTSTLQNPTAIAAATEDMSGEYKCVVTVAGCASLPVSTFVLVRGILDDPRGDGNGNAQTYRTIRIGTQTWMSENLKWKDPQFSADFKEYNNNPNYGLTYGTLYNYKLSLKAATGVTGWRVPTDQDWAKLIDFLGGYLVAGSKLKEEGTTHWVAPNQLASNTSGFTAIGSGYYDVINALGFQDLGNVAYYWSSTPYESAMIIYKVRSDNFWSYREQGDKSNFYSIRLVKN